MAVFEKYDQLSANVNNWKKRLSKLYILHVSFHDWTFWRKKTGRNYFLHKESHSLLRKQKHVRVARKNIRDRVSGYTMWMDMLI